MDLYHCSLDDPVNEVQSGGDADFFDEDCVGSGDASAKANTASHTAKCQEKEMTLSVSTVSSTATSACSTPSPSAESNQHDPSQEGPHPSGDSEQVEGEAKPDKLITGLTLAEIRAALRLVVDDAREVLDRFDAFSRKHPHVNGLSKMRTRFAKEVELADSATKALYPAAAGYRSKGSSADEYDDNEGSDDDASPEAVQCGLRFLNCNCVDLLELTVSILENEKDVVSVVHPINPFVMRQSILRPEPGSLPSCPFDIDVVSCSGLRWFKVKGTSRRNMERELAGFSEKRSFLSVVVNTVKAARCTLLPFGLHPTVTIAFYHQPPPQMIAALSECAQVDSYFIFSNAAGEKSLDTRFRTVSRDAYRRVMPPFCLPIEFLNFDVTALVALTTDTCNGYAGARFPKYRILDEQSVQEGLDPAVVGHIQPVLDQYTTRPSSLVEMCRRLRSVCGNDTLRLFVVPEEMEADDSEQNMESGKQIDDRPLPTPVEITPEYLQKCGSSFEHQKNWILSDVAFGEFKWIIDTIAGAQEKQRARKLLPQMIVVPTRDAVGSSDKTLRRAGEPAEASSSAPLPARTIFKLLEDTGRVALRHRVVFGVGDVAHAITISANKAFVQAARDQGVECCVAFHPSRALTERKRLGIGRTDGPRKPPDSPVLQL